MSGSVLSDRAIQQINQLYRDFYAFKNQWQAREFRPTQPQYPMWVRLDGDLAAATGSNHNTSSRPTVAASIFVGNGSGGLSDSGNDVMVVNRSDIAYTSSTFGAAFFINGEWQFFGNCNPF